LNSYYRVNAQQCMYNMWALTWSVLWYHFKTSMYVIAFKENSCRVVCRRENSHSSVSLWGSLCISTKNSVLTNEIFCSLPHSPFLSKFHEGMMMILYDGGCCEMVWVLDNASSNIMQLSYFQSTFVHCRILSTSSTQTRMHKVEGSRKWNRKGGWQV